MPLTAFAFALALQGCGTPVCAPVNPPPEPPVILRFPCGNDCEPVTPAPDAPSVEAARRWMQAQVNLAEAHNRDSETALVNATTSLTPEAEHVPTGARCRFWYGSADISFAFFNGRDLSCQTRLGWVAAGATIFHREARAGLPDTHFDAYTRDPAYGAPEVARMIAARLAAEAPDQSRWQVSPYQVRLTPGGHRISFVSSTIAYPGGAPDGTPQRRYGRRYVAEVGEWILIYASDGPEHYRAALDDYAETGFAQLLESVEQAGRILSPAAAAHAAAGR